MNSSLLNPLFDALHPTEKALISMLALIGPIKTHVRMADYLAHAQLTSPQGGRYTQAKLKDDMDHLASQGLMVKSEADGYRCAPALIETAINHAVDSGQFNAFCHVFEQADKFSDYGYAVYFTNFEQGVRLLQLAMIRGGDRKTIQKYLTGCSQFTEFRKGHPFKRMGSAAFSPRFMALLHPEVHEMMLCNLLDDATQFLTPAQALVTQTQAVLQTHSPSPLLSDLAALVAEQMLLCGQFDQAQAVIAQHEDAQSQALRGVMQLLRGDLEPSIACFEAALKTYRLTCSPRNSVFSGLPGYFHLVAMLRSPNEKQQKKLATYLDTACRNFDSYHPVFEHMLHMRHVMSAHIQIPKASQPSGVPALLPRLFLFLIDAWLGVALDSEPLQLLQSLHQTSVDGQYHWVTAVTAELLGRHKTLKPAAEKERLLALASNLRQQLGVVNLLDWFERQEPWERQLAALARLNAPSKETAVANSQTRLIWEIAFDTYDHIQLQPREQKRKGQAAWAGGRPVALKRLKDTPEEFDYLTPQDRLVCACIEKDIYNYRTNTYLMSASLALPRLIDHPLVFLQDKPGVRVEILRGVPELEIKKTDAKTLSLRLQPAIDNLSHSPLVTRETPTRLRVLEIKDEHRHIGSILGKSLSVPLRAKEQVLDAIRAISSLITIQSDLDVLPSNVPQMEADDRLHVHLMPQDAGLKICLRVRPFKDAGPYYTPGAGADSVIAEIEGQPLQARRHLAAEAAAVQALDAQCSVWREAPEQHGERLVEDPQDCLELLLQLQALADRVVLAWPQGEKFKVSRELGGSHFSMAIKQQQDWFAVSGELQVDDQQVLDLQRLLELTAGAHGRFIHLGDNQFLALTESFRRHLDEVRAYADGRGKNLRVHPLAAAALQDLADEAGKLKTDKFWKDHLAKLTELDSLTPVLPTTLQADLRDYQFSGFEWLNRLAHWGVGACLADDMGLGKTLQALALLLSRAPAGPALVVAPTSVCMNWLGEIARFAPTLNVLLFGAGDRAQTLAELKPFDLVVVSYGLLQQEAERFAAVPWHTLVLDEAQAIKNQATKRSQAAMALQADFRVILSGTPLENHLGELWNLFRFINPGLLGSLEQFNERYAGPIERQQNAEARNRLRKLISPFILRRTKSQVLTELPSRTEILRQVVPSAEEKALYEALRRQALERLAQASAGEANGQHYIEILAEIMKLRRVCCNPQLVAPELGLASSKLAAFGELLDELLANHHKALVFSQFVDHLGLIRADLDARGVRYQYLDGATPMQERKKRVDAFQAGDGDVFLISLKAGGTGLNLTAADYVIHMDPWWNPAVEDQASDRAHRIGQTRPVTIYRLVVQDTIEEKIVDLHKTKRALADSLLEGSDLAAKMSADDMLALLQDEWRGGGE